jgi:hypothetical protein
MSLVSGRNIPASISGTGAGYASNGLYSNHIFNAGIEKPQVLKTLLVKYPEYYMLDIQDKLGISKKIQLDSTDGKFAWSKMGRTRKGSTVSSVSNNTTASATITTDIAYTDANAAGYWLPNDTFYVVDSGVRGIVTAVGNSGGFQTITVSRIDGTNWAVATLAAAMKIGHTGSAYPQGSSGSGGYRSYFPDSDYNYSTIARRGIKVTRNMLGDKTIFEDGTWFYNHEDIEQKEFMKDIDAGIFFGTRYKGSSFSAVSNSRGLLEYAEQEGQQVTFSSAIGAQEADLKLLIEKLVPQQGSPNILLGCGLKLYSDLQSALGNNYRPVPTSTFQEKTGIKVDTYHFFGKDISLLYLPMFNDEGIVPQVAASSTAKDFQNFGIALDFGSVGGGKTNIEVGWVQEVTQKAITGMASDSFEVSSAFDGAQFELLAEYMPICYAPNRLGLIYANS